MSIPLLDPVRLELLGLGLDTGPDAWSWCSATVDTCGVVGVEGGTYKQLLGVLALLLIPLGVFFLFDLKKLSAVVANETGVPFGLLVVTIVM